MSGPSAPQRSARSAVFHAARRTGARAERALAQARRAAGGLFDGVALAVADDELLQAVDEQMYDIEPMYLDPDYNRGGLFWWEAAAVRRWFPRSGRVFVWAAGGGREVVGLHRLGYEVECSEYNGTLDAALRQHVSSWSDRPAVVHEARRDEWPATAMGPFDGVVLGWSAFSLVRHRHVRIELLRRAAAAMRPEGPLLVSYFDRAGAGAYVRAAGISGRLAARLASRAVPEPGDVLTPNFAHVFSDAELRDELRDGGFDVVSVSLRGHAHAVASRREG